MRNPNTWDILRAIVEFIAPYVIPFLIVVGLVYLIIKRKNMEQNQSMGMGTGTESAKKMTKSWFLKWILALGIVIVMNLLFNYGLRTFYKPAPFWDDFCKQEQVTIQPKNQNDCVAVGGAWTDSGEEYLYGKNGEVQPLRPEIIGKDGKPVPVTGWCNLQYTCSNNFNDATRIYNRNAFIVLVLLGIMAIIASFFVIGTEAVSLGLSLGGVVSTIVGSVQYWSDMDDKLRFGVLLVGFIDLIWLGIKKVRE